MGLADRLIFLPPRASYGGGRDPVVAPWHGRRLYEALPEHRRALLRVDDAGHNDVAAVAGRRYWRALGDFARAFGATEAA